MLIEGLAALSLAASAAPGGAPALRTLGGLPLPSRHRTLILLFWRPDCGPCQAELSDLAALRRAAAPADLKLVGLQPAAELEAALQKRALKPRDSVMTPEEPAGLLARLGGVPPRLPLAVAFRPNGALCAAHTGLVGRDRVRAWAQQCRVDDAAR